VLLERPGLLLTCKEQRRLVVDLEPSANGNALPPLIRLPLPFLSFLPKKKVKKKADREREEVSPFDVFLHGGCFQSLQGHHRGYT